MDDLLSMQKLKLLTFIIISGLSLSAHALPNVAIKVHPPHRIKSHTSPSHFSGFTPQQMQLAYGFSQIPQQGEGQIIAIIDAYDNPNAEADLAVFNETFSLPACTTENGCFTKVYANGSPPPGDSGWGTEISLDIQWAHAIAPKAKILLVEAGDAYLNSLFKAIAVAVQKGASVISMSWGGNEFPEQTQFDAHFNIPNVSFIAASGDYGTGTIYPSTSPYVIAVGGTSLFTDAAGNYQSEKAWDGSGGGLSDYETEPNYQTNFPLPKNPSKVRGVPDVAYNADPDTGVSVYDSYGEGGWIVVGGTSAGAPQWAALIAIAKSATSQQIDVSNTTLYNAAKKNYALNYNDVTTGSNGSCGYYCDARKGYDYVTGIGSPKSANLINTLTSKVAS